MTQSRFVRLPSTQLHHFFDPTTKAPKSDLDTTCPSCGGARKRFSRVPGGGVLRFEGRDCAHSFELVPPAK